MQRRAAALCALGDRVRRDRGGTGVGGATRRACPTRSCRWATRRSPARPGAGPATRTRAPRASTRSAPPPTTTRPAARRSPAATAPRRPRSTSATALESKNLACSGARTYSQPPGSGELQARARLPRLRRRADRPGAGAGAVRADPPRADRRRPDRRQQLRLRERRPDVRDGLAHVADVVEELLQRRRAAWRACSRPPISRRSRPRSTARSRTSSWRCERAATRDGDYRLVAQTYSSPIPRGAGFRYKETGYTRQTIGGCGIWNRDADWANDDDGQHAQRRRQGGRAAARRRRSSTPSDALAGHRLCESTVGPARGARRRRTGRRRARRTDRVGQPDPHGHDARPALPAAGGPAPELLGPARAAQLRAPGLPGRPAAGRAAARAGWTAPSRTCALG